MKRIIPLLLLLLTAKASATELTGGFSARLEDLRVMDNAWLGANEYREGIEISTAGAGLWILHSTDTAGGLLLESYLAPYSTFYFRPGSTGRIEAGFGINPEAGFDLAVSSAVVENLYGGTIIAAPLMAATTIVANVLLGAQQVNADLVVVTTVAASGQVTGNHFVDVFNAGYIVPGGALLLFDGACPTGWTEYTGARGRYLVGVPSGGTISGVVGAAMTDISNAAHSHTLGAGTDISAGANYSDTTGGVVRGNIAPYVQLRLCRAPTP